MGFGGKQIINAERRFTILGLEIRKLRWTDLLFIFAYAGSVSGYHFASSEKDKLSWDIWILFAHFFFLGSSYFGLRLRNIYFSIIWLLLSLAFLINNLPIAGYPLALFVLYHIVRAVFWYRYDREFIPFIVGRGKMERYRSEIEGRTGGNKDKDVMKILFTVSVALLMLFSMTLTNTRI